MDGFRSDNQMAQDEGDTAANTANEIRRLESAVTQAWRTLWWNTETNPTVAAVSAKASEIAGQFLGEDFCDRVCFCRGLDFSDAD